MDFSPLTTFMDSLIERGIPGCDIIIQQDHKTLFRYMTGCRDREAGLKMRGDEMYFMYSVSKPVTVTAALQLLEKGLFLLTDPVSDYLPEYRDLTVRQADGSVRIPEVLRPFLGGGCCCHDLLVPDQDRKSVV